MANRVSARRARLEQQKAKRNLFLATILAIVIGVVFLFVAVPLIFQFAIDFARSQDTGITIGDTIAPQRPVFQPPEEHMNERELKLTGYTEAQAQVELILNGQVVSTTSANDDGEFSFTQTLDEGEYSLMVLAADEAGNESSSNEFPITVDVTSPTLSLDSPEDGATFTLRSEQVVTVQGVMSEPGRVYVNGSLNTTDDEGAFSTSLALGEGENVIKVRGEDRAGNPTLEQEVKVRYQP